MEKKLKYYYKCNAPKNAFVCPFWILYTRNRGNVLFRIRQSVFARWRASNNLKKKNTNAGIVTFRWYYFLGPILYNLPDLIAWMDGSVSQLVWK